MAVRVLLVLAALAVLYGCGQASSPVEKQEKQGGVERAAEGGEEQSKTPSSPEATTERAVGNIPIAGVIGENVEAGSFDLRVLDYFTAADYYYATDLYIDDEQDAISQAGKFVVVSYSITNTGAETFTVSTHGELHARAEDNKIEVYGEAEDVSPPHAFDDIPPRQMLVSQFIFDVPTDVEPELVAVSAQPDTSTSFEVGSVDLREDKPQEPRPEEMLALQYEYYNMADYERAYELFAQETKDRVSEQAYGSLNEREDEQGDGYSFTQYSFPSVEIEGDHATIEVVRSYSYEDEEGQERITQEAVLEDEGWRIVMRDEQYKFFEG